MGLGRRVGIEGQEGSMSSGEREEEERGGVVVKR